MIHSYKRWSKISSPCPSTPSNKQRSKETRCYFLSDSLYYAIIRVTSMCHCTNPYRDNFIYVLYLLRCHMYYILITNLSDLQTSHSFNIENYVSSQPVFSFDNLMRLKMIELKSSQSLFTDLYNLKSFVFIRHLQIIFPFIWKLVVLLLTK